MSRKRSVSIILFLSIASCLILTNWNTIRFSVMRWNLERELPESREEFSDALRQIPFAEDELISRGFIELRIPDNPPDCIAGRSLQIFASTNNYATTLSQFIEKFENVGWISKRNPERTPDDVINYMSPNEHMLFSVFPLSQFDLFQVEFDLYHLDYPDNLGEQENVYALVYRYHNPDIEVCTF